MKLLYFRIENVNKEVYVPNTLLSKDFNFSSKHFFSLEEGKINLKKINNNDFFNVETSNIYNISALVGENGSGKSSMLSLIINIVYENYKYSKCSYVLIFEEKKHIYTFYNNTKIKCNFRCIQKEITDGKAVQNTLFDNETALIYYSSCFSWNDYYCKSKQNYNYYNLSLNSKLEPFVFNSKNSNIVYNTSFIDNRYNLDNIYNRKEESLKNYIVLFSKTDLYGVNKITIKLKYQNNYKNLSRFYDFKKCRVEKELYDYFKTILKNKNNKVKARIVVFSSVMEMFFSELNGKFVEYKKEYKQSLFDNIFKYYFITDNEKTISSVHNTLVAFFEYLERINTNDISSYKDIFISNSKDKLYVSNNWDEIVRTIENDFSSMANKYIILLKKIVNIMTVSDYQVIENDEEKDFYKFIFNMTVDKKNYTLLIDLVKNIDEHFSLNPFIFDYKAQSAGFYSRIELESSLYNAIGKINRRYKYKANDIIIILDEPDLYYHPKWSRKMVNDLIQFLCEFPDNQFQIIMASNKPFIISDLPKENVITIGRDKIDKTDTFASNIMDLLELDFFMDNYIGEFAVVKIKKIIAGIKNNDKDIEKQIDKIGDIIIRKSLYRLLKERRKNK